MKTCFKFLLIAALSSTTYAWAHSGATGIVKERMDNFKESKASMKQLKKAVRRNDFETISTEAASINSWAIKLIDYFPEGSNHHPSEALDLIWTEFDKFKELADKQISASEKLQTAASNKDEAEVFNAYKELGQSCKGCHDQYKD